MVLPPALLAITAARGMGIVALLALLIYGVVTIVRKPKSVSAADHTLSPTSHSDRLPFKPLQVIAAVLAIFVLTQVVAGLFVTTLLSAVGYSAAEVNDLLAHSSWIQLLYMVLVDGGVVAVVYWVLKRRGFSLRAIGLVRPQYMDVLYAIVAYVVYFGVLLFVLGYISQLFPHVNWNQKQELGFDANATGTALLPIFISLVILPPIAEEIMMRGLLYTGLRSTLPFVSAAVVASVLFGLAHLFNGDALLWAAAIDTCLLSFALVWLREKRGSLWPCITLHAIKNGMAFMYLFVFKIV